MNKTLTAKIFMWVAFVVFMIYAITLIFPFVWMFLNSFKDNPSFFQDPWGLPKSFAFTNYATALNVRVSGGFTFIPVLLNSVIYSIISPILSITFPFLAAYACSKYKFKLRGLCTLLALIMIAVPIVGQTAATYKLFSDLNLYNNWYWGIFLVGSSGFGGNYLMIRAALDNTSWTYAEAGFIDGASDLKVMIKIMLPMVKPILIILAIMGFIGAWNDYTSIWLFAPSYPTIGVAIKNVIDNVNEYGHPVLFSIMLISIVPVIAVFIAFQNTIMNHFIVGGLKG